MNLPNSRDRAVPIGDLAESYNRSRRSVERELEQMVLDGHPVVACERGVYIAQVVGEIDAYADALENRVASQLHRIRSLRRIAETMRHPMTLWENAA